MKRPVLLVIIIIVALGVAVGSGYWLGRGRNTEPVSTASPPPSQRQVLYWFDPMVPAQHFDKPGKSPFMDMTLVPRYADSGSTDVSGTGPGTVAIDPRIAQTLGTRTTQVRIGQLQRELRVPATVEWDLRQAQTVSARVDAIVARLNVRAPFESVRVGQPLAELLAPEWNAAIAEYRALGEAHSADAAALRDAARQHLAQLGLDPAEVRGADSRIVLRAPVDGLVSELDVRDGQRVRAGDTLFRINGIDSVWLDAAIPQANIAGIDAGTAVSATSSALPDETFAGRIETLLPEVDAKTRTQRARIVLDNPQHHLAPGMFADVRITATAGAACPLVPDEALIATGNQTRVILAEAGGRFRPVAVRTGLSSGGMTEVLSGLSGGEHVVVSAQFLIDSEASLSGALERLGNDHGAGDKKGADADGAPNTPNPDPQR